MRKQYSVKETGFSIWARDKWQWKLTNKTKGE